MKTTQPKYSIVIPAFNEADYLDKTLKSLKKLNTKIPYEVIVVDNNSTDATPSIAKKHGAILAEELDAGVCYARQRGTELAKGKYVISTDADTTFNTDWLDNIDAVFKANPKFVAVAGPCRYSDGPSWGMAYPYVLFGLVSFVRKITGRVMYVTATNIAFKKSAWAGYNTNLSQGGDELYLLSTLKKKGKVYFNNANPVSTSGRRLKRGLVYNLFVTFLFYYVMEYNLTRVFNRPVIGSAPIIRANTQLMTGALMRALGIAFVGLFLVFLKNRI